MSDQLDEWIAAWLRGDISASDRSLLEQKMAEDPELREELDELRQLHEFEQYTAGHLTASEAAAFAERLANDEVLRQEYADYEATRRVLEIDRIGSEQDAVRAEIERQQTQKKDDRPRPSSWRKWLPLIIGLALLALSIPFLPNEEPESIPALDAFPVAEPPPPPVPIGPDPDPKEKPTSSETQGPIFADLLDAELKVPYPGASDVPLGNDGVTDIQRIYLQEKYAELRDEVAPIQIDSLIARGDRTLEIVLLASARLLASPPQCRPAYDLLTRLEKARSRQFGRFMQAADWYRALSLLCLERSTEAIPILQSIAAASGGHEFKRAAQRLLDALPE